MEQMMRRIFVYMIPPKFGLNYNTLVNSSLSKLPMLFCAQLQYPVTSPAPALDVTLIWRG